MFFSKIKVVLDDGLYSYKIKKNTTLDLPIPIKEGYVFDGWYLNDTKVDSKTKLKKNCNLVSKWHLPSADEFISDIKDNKIIDNIYEELLKKFLVKEEE